MSQRYTVDDIYNHFNDIDIKIMDLWQSSHNDARRKSFVIVVPNEDSEYIKDDATLEGLGIKVREYKERKFSTF